MKSTTGHTRSATASGAHLEDARAIPAERNQRTFFDRPWVAIAGCVAILVAINLYVFWDHWRGTTSFTYDFPAGYYAFTGYWITSVQMGEWPHWIPYQSMGYPSALNPQLDLFYPPFWIFVIFRIPYTLHAANVLQLLHVLFGSIGFFAVTRRLFKSTPVALCGGIAFAFFGGFFSNSEHVDVIRGYSWIPWILLALIIDDRVTERQIRRWRMRTRLSGYNIALPVILYCFITGSYPGLMFSTLLMMSVFIASQAAAFYWPQRDKTAIGDAAVQATQVAMALGMAAVFLLPTGYASQELARNGESTEDMLRAYLHVKDLYHFIIPSSLLTTGDYSMYGMQLPVVLLAFIPLARVRKHLFFVPLFTVAALAFVLCLKGLHPVALVLWRVLPFLRLSRFPVGDYRLYIYIAVLTLGLAGLHECLTRTASTASRVVAMLSGLLGLCAAWIFAFGVVPPSISREHLATWEFRELLCCAFVIAMYEVFARRNWLSHGWALLTSAMFIVMMVPVTTHMRVYWNDPNVLRIFSDGQFRSIFSKHLTARPARQETMASDWSWRGYLNGTFIATDKVGTLTKTQLNVERDAQLRAFVMKPGELEEVSCSAALCNGTVADGVDVSAPRPTGTSISYARNTVTYDADVPEPSLLVENEIYAPGWSAHCETHGENLTPVRVDNAVRGWVVPAGKHRLVMRFRTPLLGIGLMISMLSFMTWLAVPFVWMRASRVTAPKLG